MTRTEIIEDNQDYICDYCEKNIIYSKSLITFLCECKYCKEASDGWFCEDPVGIRFNRELKLKRILNEKSLGM